MTGHDRRGDGPAHAIARWGALIALCCLATLAILLPLPDESSAAWLHGDRDPEAVVRWQRVADVDRQRNEAWRDWHAMRGLARWRASGAAADTAPVRVDASVPDSLRPRLDSAIAQAWTALGSGASRARAQVFVYADTATPGLAGTWRPDSRMPLRTVVLPSASGAERCLVLVHLPRVANLSPGVLATPERLFGACGWLASFGEPGAAARRWLERTHWRPAASTAWSGERTLSVVEVHELTADAAACATTGGVACRRALALDDAGAAMVPVDWQDAVLHERRIGDHGRRTSLGGLEQRLLADLMHDVGAERFATIWREERDLPGAMGRALGEPPEDWLSGWLADLTGARERERVPPRGSDMMWVVGFAVVAVAAARPRERTRPRDE